MFCIFGFCTSSARVENKKINKLSLDEMYGHVLDVIKEFSLLNPLTEKECFKSSSK
jgi:hypothetical protein